MKPTFLATVTGVLLAAPFCAQAGPSARSPNPLDPGQPVPALAYDSALSGHARLRTDASASPDKNWRRANDTVAGGAASPEAAPASTRAAPSPAHEHHHPGPARQ